MIQEFDPRRFARVMQDLSGVALIPAGGEDLDTGVMVYMMDVATLTGHGVRALSLKVVHEATHARIHRSGISYHPRLRSRIETICVKEEISFAARLPDSVALIHGAHRKLAEPWWSEDALQGRWTEHLRARGMSERIIRILARFHS